MIATLMFSGVAALLVFLAGRRDVARDPRLTGVALLLMAVFPLLAWGSPKVVVLPVAHDMGVDSGFSWGWQAACIRVWGAGALMAALRLVFSAWSLVRMRGRSHLIERMGRIEVRELRGLKGPVAAGVFHPVVFVPEKWNELPERIRRMILDHESAHHFRRDPLWLWVAEIAAVVNWFNPVVWWMVGRLTMQCEYACDARVIQRQGVAADEYARLLCDLADQSVCVSPALAMAERASLEGRVKRIMKPCDSLGTGTVPLLIAMTLGSAAAFAMLGSTSVTGDRVSPVEVRTRWAADPFPGEP